MHLSRGKKSPSAETVIDGNPDDRLANIDRVLDDEGEIVAKIWCATLHEAPAKDPDQDG